MLMLAVALVITAAVLAKVGHVGQMRAADLGSMSHHWIAAHNAAQHSSSL